VDLHIKINLCVSIAKCQIPMFLALLNNLKLSNPYDLWPRRMTNCKIWIWDQSSWLSLSFGALIASIRMLVSLSSSSLNCALPPPLKCLSYTRLWWYFTLTFCHNLFSGGEFRNPSFGFSTKARVCKVAGQKGSHESHNILPAMWEGVREWTLTPQGSSTLGVGVSMDSQIFRGQL